MKIILIVAAALLSLSPSALADAPKARRVEIAITGNGYKPAKVEGKPGEKLLLVFKIAGDPGCCGSVVVPSANFKGKAEAGKPLEVPLTVPASGKLTFACPMEMCQGEVVPR